VEELDLIALIKRVFAKALNNLKNLILILSGSLGLSIILFYLLPDRYSTSLTASCNLIKVEAMEQVIQNIEFLVKNKDYALLEANLNLNQSEVIAIKDIKFVEIRPSLITANMESSDLFKMEIELAEKIDLAKLQIGIIGYINDNENLKQISAIQKSTYLDNLERVNNEIKMLETTREILLRGNFKSQNYILMNPSQINEQLVSLTRQKNDLTKELTLFSPVKIIQPFNALSRPSFPILSYFLLGGFIFGIISSLIFLVFKS